MAVGTLLGCSMGPDEPEAIWRWRRWWPPSAGSPKALGMETCSKHGLFLVNLRTHRALMGACSSNAMPDAKKEAEAATTAGSSEKMQKAQEQAEQRRRSSLDDMMRKGSLGPEVMVTLIAREQELSKREERLKERAGYYSWLAAGAPGSQGHHYSGDEARGRRKKAAADDETDSSSDDEGKIAAAEKAVRYADKYARIVRENRAELEREYPSMAGSLLYRSAVAEADDFAAEKRKRLEAAEAGAGYAGEEEPSDAPCAEITVEC